MEIFFKVQHLSKTRVGRSGSTVQSPELFLKIDFLVFQNFIRGARNYFAPRLKPRRGEKINFSEIAKFQAGKYTKKYFSHGTKNILVNFEKIYHRCYRELFVALRKQPRPFSVKKKFHRLNLQLLSIQISSLPSLKKISGTFLFISRQKKHFDLP